MVAMENPKCIARLVPFKVVAVAMQPRFHHIQKLLSNEVAQLDISAKWVSVSKCVLLFQQNVCIFTVVMKVSDEKSNLFCR